MTLPDERYRAVIYVAQFLLDLATPSKTPRVPRDVRREALRLLRHYPHEFEMARAAKAAPDLFLEERTQTLVSKKRGKKQS